MLLENIPILGVGFVLGALHCAEPDHLAAVATMISERCGRRRAGMVGALWGLGHSFTMLVAGSILVLLKINTSAEWQSGLELMVGSLLIALGTWRLGQAIRGVHSHEHHHEHETDRPSSHNHFHLHLPFRSHSRHRHTHLPLLIGGLHGLAGTSFVILLVPTAVLDSIPVYFAFLLVFGWGTIGGMTLIAHGLGRGISAVVARRPVRERWLAGIAGAVSMVFGIIWTIAATTELI